ncbi:AbiJ-NTD4 domain-containing protein [Vibrio sp. TBV020]|uniref:AbiJ-NTD4 domain-containing protein n=1 Tax=Vibrio sp. TBV020 TaxID=3137398 RepID=UPI0038CDC0AB
MKKNFSRRHKLDYEECDLIYEFIPSAFKYDLYKLIDNYSDNTVQRYVIYRELAVQISKEHYQLFGSDDIHEFYTPDMLIQLITKAKWHEVLSMVEYVVTKEIADENEINDLFDYHNIGYEIKLNSEFLDYEVNVKYDCVITENDRALELEIPYEGVLASIKSAKQALIDPKNIDIENSIKNSVSSIEGYLKGWLVEQGQREPATLSDAINKVKQLGKVHENICKSLEQFYIYRNRVQNVGHGSPNLADVSANEALLFNEMAISFINYFHKIE